MAFVDFLSIQGRLATCPAYIVWVGLRLRKFKENKTKVTHQERIFILKCHFVILKSHTSAFCLLFQLLGELLRPVGMDGCSLESLLRWLPAHRLRLAGCVGFSQQLSTYVSKVAHKCRPTCPQMSTMLSTFVSNQNAKATFNCRGRHEARPLQRMPATIPLCLVSQRRKERKGHI